MHHYYNGDDFVYSRKYLRMTLDSCYSEASLWLKHPNYAINGKELIDHEQN
jgi:hypothetical protein